MKLVSPVTGCPLHYDTPHSLSDGTGERWPVVDGIPYLRAKREHLVSTALLALDAGDTTAALVTLLADQDDWWTGPKTDADELRRLVAGRETLTLREAMALLRLGPVADYFAYRWVDPTYLGGLALLEAHWQHPGDAFELACGIGHYLRELGARGVLCTGADVVFAKCWIAKHWIAPAAEYVVFDAAHLWPLAEAKYDLVMCHDAFYFLPNKPFVAAQLRALVADGGTLAVSHLHNRGYWSGSKGPDAHLSEWLSLFPNSLVYDEDDLIREGIRGGTPATAAIKDHDPEVEAYSLVVGAAGPTRPLDGLLTKPHPDATLARNPLLGDTPGHEHVRWPSERWREEYQRNCWWANPEDEGSGGDDPVRRRVLVDLPERW